MYSANAMSCLGSAEPTHTCYGVRWLTGGTPESHPAQIVAQTADAHDGGALAYIYTKIDNIYTHIYIHT
jgi:hypothetical protein